MFFLNITKNNILTLDYQIKLMFYLTLIRFIFTNKVWNFKTVPLYNLLNLLIYENSLFILNSKSSGNHKTLRPVFSLLQYSKNIYKSF